MQHNVVTPLLSIVFACAAIGLYPGVVWGEQPPIERPPLGAVVLLSSPVHNVCGTGFIRPDGRVVTNKHLTDSLCPRDRCEDLLIRRAAGIDLPADIPVPAVTPRVSAVIPALDVALLDIGLSPQSAPVPPGFTAPETIPLGAPSAVGDEVTTLGFPRCGPLKISRGRVLAADQIRLTTDLRGAPGQSGSPIINGAGAATGIVDEATDVGAALTALATGGPLELRGRRLDPLDAILASPDPRVPQISRLNDFLRAHRTAPLGTRLRAALEFVIAAEDLIKTVHAAPAPDPVTAILIRGEGILSAPTVTLPPPVDASLLSVEAFTVAYAAELGSALLGAQRIDRYRAALTAQGRDAAHLLPPPAFPSAFDINMGALAILTLAALSGVAAIAWVVRRIRRAG